MNELTETSVILRQPTRDDRSYIFNSWLHNQYWGSRYFQSMNQDTFFKEYTKHITALFSNPDCKIEIASISEEPNMIIGFIVYTSETLHWGYVKKDYRNKGVLKLMLGDKTFKSYTGSTAAGHEIASQLKLEFNPFKF